MTRLPSARGLALLALATWLLFGASSAQAAGSIRLEPFSSETYDRARKSGEPFIMEFTADWCLPCKRLHEETFTDPRVIRAAEGIRFISVDLTTPDRRTELIMQSFKIPGAPTTIVYGPDGKERTRRIGFIEPADFVKLLSDVKKGSTAPAPSSPSSSGIRKI